MSDTVVIYKSKYGSTKKYAEWIKDSLKADIFESSKICVDDMKMLLETYGEVVDFTNKELIKPLVDFVVGGKL